MKVQLLILFTSLAFSLKLFAEPIIMTSSQVRFGQATGSTDDNTNNSSINITTIEPNYLLEYKNRKLSLDIDYSFIATTDNANHESEIDHSLSLLSSIDHIAEEWTSSFNIDITKRNTSDDGLLISSINPSINERSEEYIVTTLESARIFNLSQTSQFNSRFQLSSQGFKSESKSKNAQLFLLLNVDRLTSLIDLSTSFDANKNLDSNVTNTMFNITTRYNFNSKINTFLSISSNNDDSNSFNETRYSLGFNWLVSPINYINFDIGRFGDERSWGLDSLFSAKRTTLNISHNEQVIPANQTLLNNIANNESTIAASVLSDLRYVKNTSLSLNHRTRRLISSFTLSKIKEFSDLDSTEDRETTGATLSLEYTLNASKSISYSYSNNKIQTLVDNQLIEHSVNWSSILGRHSTYNVRLSDIEQENDDSSLDSKSSIIEFNYNYNF